MRPTRQLILGILCGLGIVAAIAATTYGPALGRFHGTDTLTNLQTGAVYFNTASNTFWVGGSTSNPVMVGDAAWSNNVTASITNGLVSGLTTNLTLLDGSTNALTLVFTNGLLKGATIP